MKIAIPSGIAAGLLLAVGLSVMLFSDHRATAAEQLQQVSQASKAYRGWIHMEVTYQPVASSTMPATGPALPSLVWQHVNTADGTLANVRKWDGRSTIDLYVPARQEIVKYDSTTGVIHIETMMSDSAKNMAATVAASPVTMVGALAEFKKTFGRDPVEVLRTREDGSDRYDVTLFKDEQECSRICQEKAICPLFTKMTLWVDPQTDLMQKMQFVQQGVLATANVTYGKPEIRDIYDLGAPREAKVEDNRLEADLSAVLDRLDARAAKGLGNCVAVITISDVGDDGKPDKSVGYVHLYETDANRWFIAHYRIGNTTGRAA